MAETTRWLSAHLHLRPDLAGGLYGEAGDRVVLDLVAPLARRAEERGWADRWFFIRYTEEGPHVRFRLRGPAARLDAEARPAIAAAAAADARVAHLVWRPYEPEHERYGGAAGVEVAEEMFDLSSRTACALLAKLPSPDDRPARLGKALLASLAALVVFVGERRAAAALMRRFSDSYLALMARDEELQDGWTLRFERGYEAQAAGLGGLVEAAWEALTEPSGEALPEEIACFRSGLERLRGRLADLLAAGHLHRALGTPRTWPAAVVGRLLPSYVHMTGNRLGVRPVEESYLALAAAAALAPERRRRANARSGSAR